MIAAAGRVLCVMLTSASGNVIIERFYEPTLSEREQMEWRSRLHEASACTVGVGEQDAERVAEVCGMARDGEETMVWCQVGDLRFYAVGSGEYDELALAEVLQALVTSVKACVKNKAFTEAYLFAHFGMICLALDEIVSSGVVEATDWDTIRRGIKLKMSGD